MKEQTFEAFFAGLAPLERDALTLKLGQIANVSISAVVTWSKGTRTPYERTRLLIEQHIRMNYDVQILFKESDGKRKRKHIGE